jgi:ATP-dependent DNA helicase DinG
LSDLIEAFFSEHGPLAKNSHSYSFREPQVQMAKRIAELIEKEEPNLVIEASTGTGKSFAYLAAALLSGKRTIVSTATKTLQDQLYQKDLPVVLKAVFELTNYRPKALVLKGRNNYVCLKKLDEKAYRPGLFESGDPKLWEDIAGWVKYTDTGDFAELAFLPEDSPILGALDARSEHCVGSACSFYNDCFVTRQRREAQKVDLLIVNHALMCTDGAIRAKSSQVQAEEGESEAQAQAVITSQILPDFDLWIIDEAHAFADVATRNFGIALSDKELRQLTNDILYIVAFLSKNVQEVMRTLAVEIPIKFFLFIEKLLGGQNSSPIKFRNGITPEANEALYGVLDSFREMDVALIQLGQIATDYGAEIKVLSRRIHDVMSQIAYISQGGAEKNGYLIVAENDSRGRSISAWPINPGHILQSHLWALGIPVVMTSATLAFNGSTHSFCRQMGLEHEESSLILPPIFDFQNRSALYVAQHLPNPNDQEFAAASHEEIRFLVDMSLGGTLILFTSHRALNEAHYALKAEFESWGLRVFKQGDAPKLSLISTFVNQDEITGGVLFATHSFWEGVDIPGRALRMVIIDKLPFHSVSDPLFEARMNDYEERGLAPFQELALPEAALTLKQGFGRLLRKDSDAGIAALLDSRVVTKRYGRQILRSLPSMPMFTRQEEIKDVWWHHIRKLVGGFPC